MRAERRLVVLAREGERLLGADVIGAEDDHQLGQRIGRSRPAAGRPRRRRRRRGRSRCAARRWRAACAVALASARPGPLRRSEVAVELRGELGTLGSGSCRRRGAPCARRCGEVAEDRAPSGAEAIGVEEVASSSWSSSSSSSRGAAAMRSGAGTRRRSRRASSRRRRAGRWRRRPAAARPIASVRDGSRRPRSGSGPSIRGTASRGRRRGRSLTADGCGRRGRSGRRRRRGCPRLPTAMPRRARDARDVVGELEAADELGPLLRSDRSSRPAWPACRRSSARTRRAAACSRCRWSCATSRGRRGTARDRRPGRRACPSATRDRTRRR